MKIISIAERDFELKNFDCGIYELNHYLTRYAKKNHHDRIGKTYLAVEDDAVVGFYTLASASISFKNLKEEGFSKLPRYPIPSIRLERLAVDINYQNRGIGKTLLKHAFLSIINASNYVGVYFVIVDAKDSSINFYRKYNFRSTIDNPKTLYLPLSTIKKAVENK